ncbi:MAG: mechanosensitive ion channel domain-containing protein [Actinomycetota bacterium]
MDVDRMKVARPHLVRAVVATVVALGGLVLASHYPGAFTDPQADREDAFRVAGAVVLLLAGIAAVRAASRAARQAMPPEARDARGGPLAFIISLVGYIIVFLATLGALDTDLSGLLLGGALTGVVIGIAAQQTLGNFFAGIVLLAIRPFTVGDHVVMRSGPLGGEYQGRVTSMSMFYVHMNTELGPVSLPNAGVLAAAVGPGARVPKDEELEEEMERRRAEKQEGAGPQQGGPPTTTP